MKRPPLPNAVFHRASVRCVCGRPLFDLLDHPQATDGTGPASRVQVDCPQCQYLVFLLLRWRGLPRQKRAVLVVHTVDLRAGKVVLSEIFIGAKAGDRRGDRGGERAPAADLAEALRRPWAAGPTSTDGDAASATTHRSPGQCTA